MLCEPKEVQSVFSLNTFTAQEAGIYSNAHLTKFWNRALFNKHSDATLKLLGKPSRMNF